MQTSKSFNLIIIRALLLLILPAKAQHPLLINAHSHNDYTQKHPLIDALQNGFTSIEADVYLVNNKLIVSHTYPFFTKNKTLESLYLNPLQDSVTKNNSVYSGFNRSVILMIDIKSDASKTYTALKIILEKYKPLLTTCNDGKITNGPLIIVLSGHKPVADCLKEKNRLVFLDDDLLALDKINSDNVYKMASANYSHLLKWKGNGIFPKSEKQKLLDYVSAAHQQNKEVRLWASPENEAVWRELLDCGVDLICTDKLTMLKEFLVKRE